MVDQIITLLLCLVLFNIMLFFKEGGGESALAMRLLKIIGSLTLLFLFIIYILWRKSQTIPKSNGNYKQKNIKDFFKKLK